MNKQVINFDDKQPLEDMPTKNSVSKEIQTQINEVEGPSNPESVKKNFDEVISQFQRALQYLDIVNNKMQNVPSNNNDEVAETKSYYVDYNTATQDNIDQREELTESSLVSSNADDEAVLCSVDSKYTKYKKEENETTCGESLPIHEQMDVDVSANVAKFTNFIDSSDEETTPKKSKQFTFKDSDLPDSDEIREILMMYPKPPPSVETYSNHSDSESSSEDESEQPISRRRYKSKNSKDDFNKMFEVLPARIITRKRKQTNKYGFEDNKIISSILKPRYLTEQEDEISADIIIENMKRFKTMRKGYIDKDSQHQESVKEKKKENSYRKKEVRKSNQRKTNLKVKIVNTKRKVVKPKSKLNSGKNAELKIKGTKEHSFNSISAAETTNKATRSTKDKNHIEMTQNNRIILRNRNKYTDKDLQHQKSVKETKKENLYRKEAVNKSNPRSTTKSTKDKNHIEMTQNNRIILRNRNNKIECKPINKKVRARLIENKVRRSKRQLKAKERSKDTTAIISIFKKRIREPQSSNISPKSLKRSLVVKSNVSNPKRMTSRKTNNNQEINNKTSRASKKLQLDIRVPYVNLVRYQPTKEQIKMLNSNSNLLKMRTRRQSTRRSVQTNQERKT